MKLASGRLTQLQRSILLVMLEEEETKERELKGDPLLEAVKPSPPLLFVRAINEEELRRRREKLREHGLEEALPERYDDYIGMKLSMGEGIYYVHHELRSNFGRMTNCLKNLEKKGLLLGVTGTRKGGRGQRFPRTAFVLSPRGRLVAKILRFEKSGKAKVDAMADELIEKAVKALREEKAKADQPPYATATEILEKLWQLSPELYENERRIFDKYWNKTRLGEKMKKKYKLIKKVLNGKRVWVYVLYSHEERIADLKRALLMLKERHPEATVDDIQERLWEICESKFGSSEEVLEDIWNERLIGRFMRKLGHRKRRPKVLAPKGWLSGTSELAYVSVWVYDLRGEPKDLALEKHTPPS